MRRAASSPPSAAAKTTSASIASGSPPASSSSGRALAGCGRATAEAGERASRLRRARTARARLVPRRRRRSGGSRSRLLRHRLRGTRRRRSGRRRRCRRRPERRGRRRSPARIRASARPRTERCTSLSTSTEHGNAGSSRLASRIPSQPPSWGASVTLPDTGSTTPGVPTPTACRLPRSTAGGRKDLVRRGRDEIEEGIRVLPVAFAPVRRRTAPSTSPVEVGDDHQHLVGADVDAEHVAQVAAKAEQTGARPGAPRPDVQTGDVFSSDTPTRAAARPRR